MSNKQLIKDFYQSPAPAAISGFIFGFIHGNPSTQDQVSMIDSIMCGIMTSISATCLDMFMPDRSRFLIPLMVAGDGLLNVSGKYFDA